MAPQTNTLAARIVAQSDVKAERLISLLRMSLAVMLFMGVSYVLSRAEAYGLENRRFELNALRLGAIAYFALGLLNFYLSHTTRFKPWMSWAFNFAEVSIVALQLYVDVADPQTPSLLAFASPVVLVVALVVCVQALRYQIYLHIVTCALLLFLCAAVLLHDPQLGQPMPAPALAELQAVYSLPPSIMRLFMLFAIAVLIGTTVYKSRQLVERVGRETEIAENRKRFLPNEIAETMSDADLAALQTGQERNLAVLFVDIRGFTNLSERIPPRETAALLSRYRALITDAALANDGIVDKFIGDGALLIFGLHCDMPRAAQQALATSGDIQQAVQSWNTTRLKEQRAEIALAMGLHAGPAIIGAIGDQRRLEFTAIGPTVNLSSRLEEVAKQYDKTLVASRTVVDLTPEQASRFVSLGPKTLRGSSKAIEIFAL